ncbi:MAG: sulfatase-like hydrolase/transferase [Pirellulales bacterium]|nr:sulfatase-like hydrolase/transferase [Pirellulales bacterium]
MDARSSIFRRVFAIGRLVRTSKDVRQIGESGPATGTHEHVWKHDRAMLVSLAAGLAVILVTAKFLLLPYEVSTFGEFVRYCLRLAIVFAGDIFFVFALTFTVGAIGRWAIRSKWTAWPWRIATVLLFEIAGLYTVLAFRVFMKTTEMITIRMLSFMGEPGIMLSSFERYLTHRMVILFCVICGGLLIVPLVGRYLARMKLLPALTWKTMGAGMVLVTAYAGVCKAYINDQWTDPNRWELRISDNPQSTLLLSYLKSLARDEELLSLDDFGEIDVSDFQGSEHLAIELPAGVQRPKNVLMIVMESVGAEYLNLYGSKHETMPNLAAAAAENGVIFENFYIQVPYSCKSLVSLTTSVYPRSDWNLIVRDRTDLPVPTIAEQLADNGYRAAFLHSGYWSWKYRDQFFGRDERVELIDATTLPGPYVNSWGKSDTVMYEAALDWMENGGDDPFFLFAFTIETHHPYSSDGKYSFDVRKKNGELDRYLNAIREADAKIGWVLQELKDRGLDESTLVVVTSDHGEAFGQHGQWIHGFGCYQPNMQVPLVMLHPSLKHMPRRNASVRQQIDVPPTLASLLDVDPSPLWQGKNLFRQGADNRAYFFSLGGRSVVGLRDGKFKYMYYVNSGFEQLFDIDRDPQELENLAAQHPQRCDGYRKRVGGFIGYQRNFFKDMGAW